MLTTHIQDFHKLNMTNTSHVLMRKQQQIYERKSRGNYHRPAVHEYSPSIDRKMYPEHQRHILNHYSLQQLLDVTRLFYRHSPCENQGMSSRHYPCPSFDRLYKHLPPEDRPHHYIRTRLRAAHKRPQQP